MLVCGRCCARSQQTPAMRARARAVTASTAVFLALSIAGLACRDWPFLRAYDAQGTAASLVMLLALAAMLPMCWFLWRQLRSARCPACGRGWMSEHAQVHGHARAAAPGQPGARPRGTARWCLAIACALWGLSSAWSLGAALPAPRAGAPARPPWAVACGDDQYGCWADLALAGQQLRMRWCPPGSFAMGCSRAEMEWAYAWAVRLGDAAPAREWFADSRAHRVTLSRGFWLAESCCTQQLWQAVMGGNPATFTGAATLPVEGVSWDDVQRFLVQAGRAAAVALELPSEAQWEYACRAGTSTRFSFGDDLDALPRFANTADLDFGDAHPGARRFPLLERHDGYAETAPVARFAPNPWGLYDMHGNVQQWCADWYADYPPGSATDPRGPPGGLFRVIRGGAWCIPAASCRSAERSGNAPDARRSYVGFRLCAADAQR
jgi:sulfatase modifying factor 1